MWSIQDMYVVHIHIAQFLILTMHFIEKFDEVNTSYYATGNY